MKRLCVRETVATLKRSGTLVRKATAKEMVEAQTGVTKVILKDACKEADLFNEKLFPPVSMS